MEPIVNGLEIEAGDGVFFEQLDANSARGRTAMNTYGLRGHPSYVILDEDGAVLWQHTGQTEEAFLRVQLQGLIP